MKRLVLGVLLLPFLVSTALADFKVVMLKSQVASHDIKTINGETSDGIYMGWGAPGLNPKLAKDDKLMFIVGPADKFICNKSVGDRQELYWTWVDKNGEESDDQEITLVVFQEGHLLRGSALLDGTSSEKMFQLFDAMQYHPTLRFYYDEDCGKPGYTEISTKGFLSSLLEFNSD
jgi:hypothetical protein